MKDNNITNIISYQITDKKDKTKSNKFGQTLLHVHASNNDFDALEKTITGHIDVNLQDNRGKTALHYCAVNNNYKAVSLLLKNDARTDIADVLGYTALWDAVLSYNGNVSVVVELLLYASSMNVQNNNGQSILDFVCSLDDEHLTEIFEKFRFD